MSAIKDSVNTVAVRVLDDVGVDTSFDFLYYKLGMKSLVTEMRLSDGSIVTDRGVAALALGQQNYGVTVREMTGAYSVLANAGVYNTVRSYYKVTDAMGNVLLSCERESEQAISSETAGIMTLMLQEVVTSGTAKAITLDSKIDVAGKTGTTQDNCDKWFIGYTPYFIGGVWCGYEYPEPLDDITGNPCITVWDEVMTILHEKYVSSGLNEFDIPNNIVKVRCCADSGKLLTSACRIDARGNRGVWCYFKAGSEPSSYCTCHITVDYDMVDGGVACRECPVENIKKVGMIQVSRSFPVQVYVTDAQYVWRQLSGGVTMSTDPTLPFFSPMLGWRKYCGISRGGRQFNRGCAVHTQNAE